MFKAYKYKLMPNEEQLTLIKQTCGCTRVVYNYILAQVQEQLNNKQDISTPKVSDIYQEKPFLKGMDSLALANARLHINKALNDFFKSRKGKRKGKKLGFPKFKKKGKSKDSYTTNNQSGSIRIVDNTIKIPKIGFVKFKNHTPVSGVIKSVTITLNKDNTVDISVLSELATEKKIKQIKNVKEITTVGLDMSRSSFFVSSDGEKPNFQRESTVYLKEKESVLKNQSVRRNSTQLVNLSIQKNGRRTWRLKPHRRTGIRQG